MNNRAKNIVKMMAVLMGLFVCGSMLAQNGNVREETARQVGLNFLRLKDGNPRSDLQLTRVDAVQYPNLYVYNTSENGFIVVASDTRMEPILAYSDEGAFDKDNVAPGANFWFEMYEYTIDSLVRNNVRDVDEKITQRWEDLINGVRIEPERSGNYPSSFEPLIHTYWGQSWPYNKFCPSYGSYYAKTGCVATAMAQVLYYYNIDIPSDAIWYSFRHDKDEGNVLSLVGHDGNTYSSIKKNGCNLPNRRPFDFGGWNAINDEMDRYATMIRDCGLAVDMIYATGGDGSGAKSLKIGACPNESSAEKALNYYFGLDVEGYKRSYFNLLNWQELILESINNNNPIIYSGNKIKDDGSTVGHTFICDGYFYNWFHFNFGNCRISDGYYLLTNPDGYYQNQDAIFINPTNMVIWNDTVYMGRGKQGDWCGGKVYVSQGNSINDTENHIYYDSPGKYFLRNRCDYNNKTLIWNVQVLPRKNEDVDDNTCKNSEYHEVFPFTYNINGQDLDCSAEFNLSRQHTNYDVGTIRVFTAPIIDTVGNRIGDCRLHLKIEGEVMLNPKPNVSIPYCVFKNEPYNGVYSWDANNDNITDVECRTSGYYEFFEDDGGCGKLYFFNFNIEMPIIKDTTITVCTNDYDLTWLPPNQSITQHFHATENAYGNYTDTLIDCDRDKMFLFHCHYAPMDTIEREITKCLNEIPFKFHGVLIGDDITEIGLYSYNTIVIPKKPNDSTKCDKVYKLYLNVIDCCSDKLDCLQNKITGEGKSTFSNMEAIYYGLKHYFEYREATNVFIFNMFQDLIWLDIEEIVTFWNLFQSLLDPNTGMMSEEALQLLIVTNPYNFITEEYVEELVERYNRSVMYWNEGYYTIWELPEGYNPDFIEYDTASMNKAYEAYDYAIAHGFSDVRTMYDNAYELLAAEVDNIQSAVCARVTVQFNQKMTMTREAFNGTLQIFNGHESIPMEDIFVDFRIEDQQGNNCTDLFQINTLSLDQITGISGNGSLAAQTNGTALVQFIPTKNAAPTQPVVYSFGGSFSFIDPFTGEGLTYPLYPVDITVNPSPDLYVDYFMQRDILGDDALTLDVVEPSVPAELGVIINNKGAGMAKNVTLETAEPQIIDNEKGLAIDFAMYGASFNGSPRQLGLMEIPFGNIESGQTAVGEWLFTSSLLGHFISYEAHVIHNSSYGNSDLSLVSHLDIHELIHPIYAYGNLDDGINDFLVNDNPDAYDTPDSIYFSHGGKTSVGVVDNISFDQLVSPSDTIVTLTVVPSRVGWNYGVTDDPGMNQYNIVSCIRNNDNQVIPLNNVWLTFVTIPDGGDPVYENKLHIVDTIPVQQTTTYTLVFAKKPSNLRIFHGNEDEYWSNVANWEGYILPQADDEVLIDGICQLDQDAEVFSLTVAENQSLTIPEDRILTVSGSLTNADASGLVIEEGGQLMHTNTGAQGTVQKNILPYTAGIRDGWYLVSSPLAGFTDVISVSDMLSNNYDLYYYDEPTHYWINQEYAANNFTELTNGKGYLYANSEEVMLGFEGELQSGSAVVNVLLSYTDGIDLAGFNLVGNPYAHNVTSYSSVNVANGCYQINETKDDLVVSEIDEDNPLKPAEGFFVKATDVGASITFNPGRGETTNRSGSIRVELLDNGKLIDRLIMKREGEPLEKMSLNESRTKVFAMQDHREMAIVPCEGNEQPVNFKAAKNGTYTINVNTNDIEFNYLHLIDNFTGADVDLLALRQAQGPMSYTFEAKTTDYASRFRLVFSICGDADGDSETFAFFSNGNWIIINNGEATLQVIDIHGHILSSETISGSCSKTIHAAPGVYIIRLINGENVKTQKIIIE